MIGQRRLWHVKDFPKKVLAGQRFSKEGFGRPEIFQRRLWQENSGTECPKIEKALAGELGH
jgi:hypothetical protein